MGTLTIIIERNSGMGHHEKFTAMFRRAPCPHCGKQLPFWRHLSLDDTIGMPCPSCRYTLARQQRFSRAQIVLILLLLAVMLAMRNSNGHPIVQMLCGAACLALTVAIAFAQLSAPLRILFRDDGRNP